MIKLLNGDCLELMATIEDGSIDMILTDPPYGMSLKPQRKTGKFLGVKIINDDQLRWTDDFFESAYRVAKPETGHLIFCSFACIAEFIISARKAGFTVKNMLVWNKKQFGMGGNWRPIHENILVLVKGKRFVTKSNSISTIIDFSRVHHTKAQHPTQKPVDLLEHLIGAPDYAIETILDPFMGSGSTGIAAKNLNRKFIGIELDSDYFDIAKKRIYEA